MILCKMDFMSHHFGGKLAGIGNLCFGKIQNNFESGLESQACSYDLDVTTFHYRTSFAQ